TRVSFIDLTNHLFDFSVAPLVLKTDAIAIPAASQARFDQFTGVGRRNSHPPLEDFGGRSDGFLGRFGYQFVNPALYLRTPQEFACPLCMEVGIVCRFPALGEGHAKRLCAVPMLHIFPAK